MQDRSVGIADLNELRLWVESKPDVPAGDWYKDFGSFKICGHEPYRKTFLLRGQAAIGSGIDRSGRSQRTGAARTAKQGRIADMEITWLGHGSFQLRLPSGQVILMDPWIDGNPMYPKGHQIQRADTICITHGHFDHIHDAVPLAKKFAPEVVSIYETCHWLESKGVKNTRAMNKGGSQKVGDVTVTMTHAIHSCGILDDGKILYGGEACGYVLRLPDGRALYFAGDTNVFSDMRLIQQLYKPELAFLPIGDLFTMSPREAAAACELLGVKKVIPMHFGTFPPLVGTPGELAERIADLTTEVWPLQPGVPVGW